MSANREKFHGNPPNSLRYFSVEQTVIGCIDGSVALSTTLVRTEISQLSLETLPGDFVQTIITRR